MSLENCRVVLVRPQIARNIGATARVMRNMGMSQLYLVAPQPDPLDATALRLSRHGEQILRNAIVVSDISSAIADCQLVVGTSGRQGGLFRRQSVLTADHVIPIVASSLSAAQAAVVFGPERTGLTNAEVTGFHYLLNLDAAPEYPALNLAQAVAITLYEVRKAWRRKETGPRDSGSAKHEFEASSTQTERQDVNLVRPVPGQHDPLANFQMQERMFAQLEDALTTIGYLRGNRKAALMHGVRHLLGRAKLSQVEVRWLLGFCRQVRWYTVHGVSDSNPSQTIPDSE